MYRDCCSLIMALLLALGFGQQVRSASAEPVHRSEGASWSQSQSGISSFCQEGQQKGYEGQENEEGEEEESHRHHEGEGEGYKAHAKSFAGTWTSIDGAWIELSQQDGRVWGTYRGGAGHPRLIGRLRGKVHGNRLVARFSSREGSFVDTGTFTLYRQHHRIVGQWVSDHGNAGQVNWFPYSGSQPPYAGGPPPSNQPPYNQPPTGQPPYNQPPTQGRRPPTGRGEAPANFQGNWTGAQGGSWAQLTQNGDQVTGTYQGGAGHQNLTGQIRGKVVGNKLVADYTNKEGKQTGSGTFTLYRTTTGITGSWLSSDRTKSGQVNWVPDTGELERRE